MPEENKESKTKETKKPEPVAQRQPVPSGALDADWAKLRDQPFLHGDNQLVVNVDQQHMAIAFFDPFLERFNGKGITVILTKENALALASEIVGRVESEDKK